MPRPSRGHALADEYVLRSVASLRQPVRCRGPHHVAEDLVQRAGFATVDETRRAIRDAVSKLVCHDVESGGERHPSRTAVADVQLVVVEENTVVCVVGIPALRVGFGVMDDDGEIRALPVEAAPVVSRMEAGERLAGVVVPVDSGALMRRGDIPVVEQIRLHGDDSCDRRSPSRRRRCRPRASRPAFPPWHPRETRPRRRRPKRSPSSRRMPQPVHTRANDRAAFGSGDVHAALRAAVAGRAVAVAVGDGRRHQLRDRCVARADARR